MLGQGVSPLTFYNPGVLGVPVFFEKHIAHITCVSSPKQASQVQEVGRFPDFFAPPLFPEIPV